MDANQPHRKAVLGNATKPGSFWLFDSKTGFDLTHPETASTPMISTAIGLETRGWPIKIDPAKTALVVVDMQNFFLSPALGNPVDSKGLQAQKQLVAKAIPAARKAGIKVVWLNWGLTRAEIDEMPPATIRDFGFRTVKAEEFMHWINPKSQEALQFELGPNEKNPRIFQGLGEELGNVDVDGKTIDAGRVLMRDQWNADLTPELRKLYEEGLKCSPADAWVHKNRMSGFWDRETDATEYLDSNGIKTLIFAGVNTDQCVGGSVQDSYYKGYDVILLSDGVATTSPDYAHKGIEFNCDATWGFCMDCEQFWNGVNQSRAGTA